MTNGMTSRIVVVNVNDIDIAIVQDDSFSCRQFCVLIVFCLYFVCVNNPWLFVGLFQIFILYLEIHLESIIDLVFDLYLHAQLNEPIQCNVGRYGVVDFLN